MSRKNINARKRIETEPVYQRGFKEGDMLWLAQEYQRRSKSDPSLTLEDFAAQYAVPVDNIRIHNLHDPSLDIEEGHCVALWHGTSRTRAESILKNGFKPKKADKSRIYFARSPVLARWYANHRARNEKDHPAVISCVVDLSHYDDYIVGEIQGVVFFAFKAESISNGVVRRIIGLEKRSKDRSKRSKKRKDANAELTDIALTFNSAPPSIAYWLNSYLNLEGADRIQEEHEAVGKIKQWLNDQMDAGKFGEVPNEEMLEKVQEFLPQYQQ